MGIYVHIPFCKSRCYYCGFYSSASWVDKEAYLKALTDEIRLRADYLPQEAQKTLYFGGGTPSGLAIDELDKIVKSILKTWNFSTNVEMTIESNPEDCDKFADFKALGFNRLSIGIQSFDDAVLQRINRRHNAKQAIQAIEAASAAGFANVSVDFIVGLPGQSVEDVRRTMAQVRELNVSHVSIYMLSMDAHSVMAKMCEQGKFTPPDDDLLADFYEIACDELTQSGFVHYEISNFARDGRYSQHNTSYWQQQPYIGLGAAAHSYNGDSRQWNIDSISKYIASIERGEVPAEKEMLTQNDKYNELIMTRLRTMWGLNVNEMMNVYPMQWNKVYKELKRYILNDYAYIKNNQLFLTRKGWLASDAIFSDLFT